MKLQELSKLTLICQTNVQFTKSISVQKEFKSLVLQKQQCRITETVTRGDRVLKRVYNNVWYKKLYKASFYTLSSCWNYFHMPITLSLKYLLDNVEYRIFYNFTIRVFPLSLRVKAIILIIGYSTCPTLPHFLFLCPTAPSPYTIQSTLQFPEHTRHEPA